MVNTRQARWLWGLQWLDVAAAAAWSLLLLSYWLTGRLALLIHPAYNGLAAGAGIVLALVAGIRAWELVTQGRSPKSRRRIPAASGFRTGTLSIGTLSIGSLTSSLGSLTGDRPNRSPNRRSTLNPTAGNNAGNNAGHLALLPPGWSSGVLLGAALAGLLITPQPFAGQKAVQRGLTDALTVTRNVPQSFQVNVRPDERSLVDWVRTLNVYPEPDAYVGQPVQVDGFVTRPEGLPVGYWMLTRFVLTCCAADAYPVGLPVQVPTGMPDYANDTWLRVVGEAKVLTQDGERQFAIMAETITEIDQPAKPYEY